jgi:hypothetical protein
MPFHKGFLEALISAVERSCTKIYALIVIPARSKINEKKPFFYKFPV